jgi:hypothetical protein
MPVPSATPSQEPGVRCFPKMPLPALGHLAGCSVDTGALCQGIQQRRCEVNDLPGFGTEGTNDGPCILVVFTRPLCLRWKPLPTGVVCIVTILP